ncbi:hypothetical protein [Streptomyces sp. NPDC048248]|uniref:hypothetical protein n=1 Tax=Streptomyces sp. NPDC048248 TaxID=3365523 RepID=UPI00371FF939
MTARIVIHRPAGAGGRRVYIDGTALGVGRSDAATVEFLRCAGLPDGEPLLDDPEGVEWRGGQPHDYGGPSLSSA